MELDLSKPEECLKRVEEFCSKTNRVDIVINNAGLTMREEFINTDFKTC
jgi:short-subunit dehydrogenase